MGFSISGFVLEPPRVGQSNAPFTPSPNNFVNQSAITDPSGNPVTFQVTGPGQDALGNWYPGLTTVPTSADLTSILAAGDLIVFLSQLGVTYTIATGGVSSSQLTLTAAYTGSPPVPYVTPPASVSTIAYCPTKGVNVAAYNAAYPSDETQPRDDYLVTVTSELAPGAGSKLFVSVKNVKQGGSGTTGPIEIDVDAPGHGLSTGQTVVISDVVGVPANGVFQITVTSSTAFTLNGTTFSGSWADGCNISLIQGSPGLLINAGFGWSKNEVIQRFDYDAQAGCFIPMPGGPPTAAGTLDSTKGMVQLTVAPPAQALSVGVSGATYASPVLTITTEYDHGFTSNESVLISGIVGITGKRSDSQPLNSSQPIPVIVTGPTTFTITGTFTGTYNSGGLIQPIGAYQAPFRLSVGSTGVGQQQRVNIVSNDNLFSTSLPAGTTELSLSSGDLNWSPSDLVTFDGMPVYWQQQQFFPVGTLSDIGTLSDSLTATSLLLNPIPGVGLNGTEASVVAVSSGIATLTGLSGMTPVSVGQVLVITGATILGNNGTFTITTYLSPTSVNIANPHASARDSHNGSIVWAIPQCPLIRIGYLTWLQTTPRAKHTDLQTPTQGTVEWSMDIGLLKFSTEDLSDYNGTSVYYDGVLFARDLMLPRLVPQDSGTIKAPVGKANLLIPATGDLIFFVSYIPNPGSTTTPFSFYQFPNYSIITTPDTSGGNQGTVEIAQNDGTIQFSSSDVGQYGDTPFTLVYCDLPIDHGVSMRFFRCPVNLTGQNSTIKDVTAFYSVTDAVWASPIIASPMVILPATPIDDDTLVVTVGQGTGTYTGTLNRVDIPEPIAGLGYMIDFDNGQVTFGQYRTYVYIPIVEPSGFVQLPNPLVLSTNITLSLETGLDTNVFLPLTQGDDCLVDAQAGVVHFVATQGVELAMGSTGTFSGSTFTDLAADFLPSLPATQVTAGDFLLILTGTAGGVYTITAVTEHTLTVDVPPPAPALGNFSYQVLSGIEVVADRFFQTVTLTDPVTSVERITGLGSIHNAIPLASGMAIFDDLITLDDPSANFTNTTAPLPVQPGDTINLIPESGTGAMVHSVSTPTSSTPSSATITGLVDMTDSIVGQKITFSGGVAAGNNGTFEILSYISSTSITVGSKSLSGTFSVGQDPLNLKNVSTALDQSSVLSPGDSIVFAFQLGTTYTVATVTSSRVTLLVDYTGTPNQKTSAYVPHATGGPLTWTLTANSGTRLVLKNTKTTLTPTVQFSSVDESKYTVTRRLQIPISSIGTTRFRFGLPASGGAGTFSSAVVAVDKDSDFSDPSTLPQGYVEVSKATGNLNFSDVDVPSGVTIYASRRLALGTDYKVQPQLGFIQFTTRLLTNEEVLLTYVQAPPSTTPPTPAVTFSNERGTFLVRKEIVQAHPTPTATLTFNPTGKAVANNPAPSVWRGGRPQQIPRQVSVNADTSTITFNQEVQPQTALPVGTPIAPVENVYVDYYVYQAMGGEQTLTVLNPPLQVATVAISETSTLMLIASDQRPNFPTDHLMLVNNAEVYQVGDVTYDSVANITTVNLKGTQEFQSDQTNPPMMVASGPTPMVPSQGTPSYFVAELNPFVSVARGMNSITIPGNRTQAYQTNTVVYVTDSTGSFTDFYLVTASKFVPATYSTPAQTTVTLSTNALRQYAFGQHILSYSVRPIFATAPTVVYTVNPPVTTTYTPIVIRRVNGEVGEILSTPTDYTIDSTGTVTYTTALNPNEIFAVFYMGSVVQPAGPRVLANYAYSISPDNTTNGLLGQVLTVDYTLFFPDSFYYRVETMTVFKGQVEQALQLAAQAGTPSSGPMTSNSSSPQLYQQGRPGLWFPEGDYANQDIVAQTCLKYFNDAINYLEDFLHAVDGRIVGDIDGRFLFDGVLGRYDYFTYNTDLTPSPPFPPPYPVQTLINNQIDDYVQNAVFPYPPPPYPENLAYFQQAYTMGSNSRFFPSQRTIWLQNPAVVSTNPNWGDLLGTFTFQNLSSMPQRIYKRLPRAQTQYDYPYGTSTFIVNNVAGDGTLLPPWLDNSTDSTIPALVPPSPATIKGMLVIIQGPDGNFYVDEQDNATVVGVSDNPPTIVISVPAHQPAGTGGTPPSLTPVSGSSASIAASTINPGDFTISKLLGVPTLPAYSGTITLSKAANGGNNGTFNVTGNVTATTVDISPYLSGTVTPSVGSKAVNTSSDLTAIIVPGLSYISFVGDTTSTKPYLVDSATSSTLTLDTSYAGTAGVTQAFVLNLTGTFTLEATVPAGVPISTSVSQVGVLQVGSTIIFTAQAGAPSPASYTVASVTAGSQNTITLTTDYTGSAELSAGAYMPMVIHDGNNGSIAWVLPQTVPAGSLGVIPAGSTIYTSPYDSCLNEWTTYGVDDTGANGTYSFNYKVGWDVNIWTLQGTVMYQDVWWPFNGNSLIKFPTFIIPESDYIVPICNGDILEIPGTGVGVNYTAPYEFPALTGQALDDDGNITIPYVGPTFDGETTSGGGGPLNFESLTEQPVAAGPPVTGNFRSYTTTPPFVVEGTLGYDRKTITLLRGSVFPVLNTLDTLPEDFAYQGTPPVGPAPKQYDLVRIVVGNNAPSEWHLISGTPAPTTNTVVITDTFAHSESGAVTFAFALSETSDPNCSINVENLGTATLSGVTLVDTNAPFVVGPVTILANTYGVLNVTGNSYGTTLIDNVIPVQPLTASNTNWGSLLNGYGVVSVGDVVTGSGISGSTTVVSIGPGSAITVDQTMTGGNQSGVGFGIQTLQPPPATAILRFTATLNPIPAAIVTNGAAGALAAVTSVSGGIATLVLDLSGGVVPQGFYVGNQITLTGANNAGNNGAFMIVGFTAGVPASTPNPAYPASLQISNPNAVANDYGTGSSTPSPGVGAISWTIQPVATITVMEGLNNYGMSIGDTISDSHSPSPYIPAGSTISQIGPGTNSLSISTPPPYVLTNTSAVTETIKVTKKHTTATDLPTPWCTTVDTINPNPLFPPPMTQANAQGFTTDSWVSGGGIPYDPPLAVNETFLAEDPVAPYTSFVLTKPAGESVVQGVITVFVPPTVQVGWTVVMTKGANQGLRRQIVAVKSTSELTLDTAFPNNPDLGNKYRIDNPLNTYSGFRPLIQACEKELATLSAGAVPPMPTPLSPYTPNMLDEQTALLDFFTTVFTTVLKSSHGQVAAGQTTLTDMTVDFNAANVDTSFIVYVEYESPPAPSATPPPYPAISAKTYATPITATLSPVGPLSGATNFTTSVDLSTTIHVGDIITFVQDSLTLEKYTVTSVSGPSGSPPLTLVIGTAYTGSTGWLSSTVYDFNILATTDTTGCAAGGIITGPGLPLSPPTTIVSVQHDTYVAITAPAPFAVNNVPYSVIEVTPQFSNMGVYGIGTVTDPNDLTLTFPGTETGWPVSTSSLKYRIVTQFGTSLTTLQGIFSILEANAAFIIATNTFLALLQDSIAVASDSHATANGINDLQDDLGNRYALVNSTTGRLAFLDPTNSSGPVGIIQAALNTTDQLYAYRYAWINARINLQSGYLVQLNQAVTNRIATQASIINSLIQLLTVQGS